MSIPNRYYSHGLPEYAYNWRGYARAPDKASGQGLGAAPSGLGDAGPEGLGAVADAVCPCSVVNRQLEGFGSEIADFSAKKLAIVGLAALHGYNRKGKKSVKNAAIWGALAMLLPLPVGGVALYEAVTKKTVGE